MKHKHGWRIGKTRNARGAREWRAAKYGTTCRTKYCGSTANLKPGGSRDGRRRRVAA
ncbi:hypothetical protein [Paraburkholderia bannensis]|uniref:hypothetical protein n=1 Tax=Paraburkholderia bannensis TaxID=765414 RepID=UPI002ABE2134|nr:hypothetical protein [Paraburkholderia bannensis]